MFTAPEYETLREKAGFRWYVGSGVYALLELTGTPLGAYNLNPDVCIEVFRRGRPLFRERFPDAEHISMPGIATPAISYGHVNGLGSELLFPEEGEVAHTHIYDSLEQGIRALSKPVDFATAGMAPFYLDFRRKLQDAFPDERIGFSYGCEGPITTAYEMRGDGLFYDIMDFPDLLGEFLEAVCRSINEFWAFYAGVLGIPTINPNGGGLCDDVASAVPPRLFPTLVLPYWDLYFRGRTTGTRSAHVEDLRPEQLRFLEEIGLSSFDPSISARLDPKTISRESRVPFTWRLGSFHYLTMTCDDVQDWVFQAVADGASSVHTHIEAILCEEEHVPKIDAFIAAASEAKRMLDSGATRADVGACVSPEGRRRFWGTWPD
ncbi:MAG: hypothetical protein HN742_40530 [Lentisphaerae bacterium]|jgi:hypothetical protein|nr:hypothetical protein [Lentisphaerota bacterium]MBT4821546.1 hypothetical protein [Lentisphaerota bacterium]MBT5610303.1 hypothetical protein [Lentisphaerota bacterium]MBT7056406.1 hypothetical protein [Lentisphaerota bacterium]MBT7848222.1 hypothetical protein [Lentisphaerota bacterium]